MLSIVEKVVFLQGLDIFTHVTSEDLSYLAAVTEQIEYEEKSLIYKEGTISDAMYVVISGKVQIARDGVEVMIAEPGDAIGTWSLFDDEERVASATTIEKTSVLRIDKEDFLDLLADHVQITQGIFKSIVKRLRSLMSVVKR